MRVGIQADDLTGACDTGAPFAARGLAAVALLPDAPTPSPAPAVLALDTESRGLIPHEARVRARTAATRLAAHQPELFYKKVDSTLRGALTAELAGVLEGAGRGLVLLAPAFPRQRRTVADGRLLIDGQPADETTLVRDPVFPPTGASVLALLGVAGPYPVALIPLATVRRGPSAVAARLQSFADFGGALVCDAETDTDLATVAAALAGSPALPAGSAGLARALAAQLAPGAPKPVPRPRRPLLVVAGSAHAVTRAQIRRLEARGIDPTCIVTAQARSDQPDDPAAVLRRLTEAACARLEKANPGTLFLTGGETAVAVCRALGARGVRLAGEFEAGLALGTLLDGPRAGLAVVTKAGRFGDPDTLVRLWEACE